MITLRGLGVAIVDLDGVLCDDTHRLHLVDATDWDKYHAGCRHDSPYYELIALVMAWHRAGGGVVYVTSRPDKYRGETQAWLDMYDLPEAHQEHHLIMRANSDTRHSSELKRDALITVRQRFGRIEFAIDDCDDVVAMYRAAGVTCLQPRSRAY